jgi:hypothetical protein
MMLNVCVAVACALSVTFTVKLYVPAAVAAPEIRPDELSVNPGGKVPLDVHVYGLVPPLASTVWL